jgi:uncharacterized protein YndB with AHSA1/START domain
MFIDQLNPETNVLRTLLVDAPPEAIWKALTDPKLTRLYLSAAICCDLKPGKPIRWYAREDQGTEQLVAKGVVMALQPNRRLRYTTLPTNGDLPDEPGNYTTVDILLEPASDGRTRVHFWQGDFAGLPHAERRAREAGRNWVEALVGLKRVSEEQARSIAA